MSFKNLKQIVIDEINVKLLNASGKLDFFYLIKRLDGLKREKAGTNFSGA